MWRGKNIYGWAIVAGLILMSGCRSDVARAREDAPSPSPDPVEFYFYLNSDQDILGTRPDGSIDSQGEILFDQLRILTGAGAPENFGLHIYLDRGIALRDGDPTGSETLDFCSGGPVEEKILGETDSADPVNLKALLAKRCHPTARRFVILWSHGDGYRVQQDFDYNPGDRNFHISTLLAAIPDHFAEAVLFDSCAMASLEITSLLEAKTAWMVASQYELPNEGIQYGGLTATLAKGRDTLSILRTLRTDSERKFSELGIEAPLVLIDLTKISALRSAFASAWSSATKGVADYTTFRTSVLRGPHDGDLYRLFDGYAPDSKAALAAALDSGRGSLHFALPATASDRDADLDAVADAVPLVFRNWSESFPNWAAYARVRSESSTQQGVQL